jgi:hypothetical protein
MGRAQLRIGHLLAHSGGGVGAFLHSALRYERFGAGSEHVVVQLLRPQDDRFLSRMRDGRLATIVLEPSESTLRQIAEDVDLLIIHWWHHPALIAALERIQGSRIRTIMWSHVNGLHAPLIPISLVDAVDSVVASSWASCTNLRTRTGSLSASINMISHTYSFGDLEPFLAKYVNRRPLSLVYAGTIDFSKMSSSFVDLLPSNGSIDEIWLYGHPVARHHLETQGHARGLPTLRFGGHTTSLIEQLSRFGVFFYPLSSTHYGTTENVLQEAMALGLVPIVVPNATELELLGPMSTRYSVANAAETERLIQRLGDAGVRADAALEAHTIVRERWNAWRRSDQVEDQVREIVSRPPREFAITGQDDSTPNSMTRWLRELVHFNCHEEMCRSTVALLDERRSTDTSKNLEQTTWRLWREALVGMPSF